MRAFLATAFAASSVFGCLQSPDTPDAPIDEAPAPPPDVEGERAQGLAAAVVWRGTASGPVHAIAGEALDLTVLAVEGRGWELPQGGGCDPRAAEVERVVDGDVVRLRVVDEMVCGDVTGASALVEVPLAVRLPALPAGRYTLQLDNGPDEAPEPRPLYVGPACDAPPEALVGRWAWVGGAIELEDRSMFLDSRRCAAVGHDEVFSGLTVLPDGFFVGTVHTDFPLEDAGCVRMDGDVVALESDGGQRDARGRLAGERLLLGTAGPAVVADAPDACGVCEQCGGGDGQRWLDEADIELVYARPRDAAGTCDGFVEALLSADPCAIEDPEPTAWALELRVGEPVDRPLEVTDIEGGGTTDVARWSLAAGQLPPGLRLDCARGAIVGTPLAPGVFEADLHVLERKCDLDWTERYTFEVAR